MNVRREIMDVIRSSDILLTNRIAERPLTNTEKGLLEGYVMRLIEELKLSPDVSTSWDASQPDRRQKVHA